MKKNVQEMKSVHLKIIIFVLKLILMVIETMKAYQQLPIMAQCGEKIVARICLYEKKNQILAPRYLKHGMNAQLYSAIVLLI